MLKLLEPFQVNQVLNDNFRIWSPGLDPSAYRHYQWWQFRQSWGRKNLQYFGYLGPAGEVLASCKRYSFQFVSKGKVYKIAGLGAVYVPERWRGSSLGLKMLAELARLSREEGFEALMLNSDIDPAYYEKLGYRPFSADSFLVKLEKSWLDKSITELSARCHPASEPVFHLGAIKAEDIDEMCKHHRRWLSRQPFGLLRSPEYWRYKIDRELYLYQHSRLLRPELELLSLNQGRFQSGYALMEHSGPYMRVLEVIAGESLQNLLWAQILRIAQKRRAKTLRAWALFSPELKGLGFYRRDWAYPMVCPLETEFCPVLDDWLKVGVSCFLELDHF